jgi:hypothetical protein
MRQDGVGGKASSQITPDDPCQQSAQVLELWQHTAGNIPFSAKNTLRQQI